MSTERVEINPDNNNKTLEQSQEDLAKQGVNVNTTPVQNNTNVDKPTTNDSSQGVTNKLGNNIDELRTENRLDVVFFFPEAEANSDFYKSYEQAFTSGTSFKINIVNRPIILLIISIPQLLPSNKLVCVSIIPSGKLSLLTAKP